MEIQHWKKLRTFSNLASEVVIIHRREEFRASKIMVDRVMNNPKVKFALNCVVKKLLAKMRAARVRDAVYLENVKDGSIEEIIVEGIFIAIGHQPNTDLFKGILDTDEIGYLLVQPGTTRTNVEGVFAAGDVCDKHFRQAVTAAGMGCKAAIDAERWLAEKEVEQV